MRLRFATFVAGAVLLSACAGGSGSNSESTPAQPRRDFQLVADSFSFPNFASSATPELLDVVDMVEIFGDSVCADGTGDSCTMSAEAAAWAQMVNDARAFGHCEGMAVVAADRFGSGGSVSTSTLANEGDVTHAIIRAFSSQFFPSVVKATRELREDSLEDKITTLEDAVEEGDVGFTLGLYEGSSGHTVLPYAVERVNDVHAVIRVYDSNWPTQDRIVDVDLSAGTWTFSFGAADITSDPTPWTGGTEDFDLTPMSSRIGGEAPFEGGGDIGITYVVIKAATLDWSLSVDGATIAAESTDVVPVRAGEGPSIFLVPVKSERFSLNLPSAASVYSVGAGSIAHVVTDGSNEPVEFDSRSISTEGTDVVLSVAVDDLAITTEGIAATLEIGDSEISARLDDGGEPVIVSATLPRATVKLANGDVTVSPESEIATPEPPRLPEPITRNSTRFDDQRGSGTSTSTSTTGPPSPPASSATTSPPVTSSPVASTQVRASTVAPSTTAVPTPTALDVGWEPSPPNVANGTGLATIPVRLIDSSGAIVVGDSSTSVVVAIVSESGAQASLSGETSQVAVSGVARFVGLTITGQPGTYHLTFTANVAGRTLTARSITFTMG